MEHKLLNLSSTNFKFNGETGKFEGYASVFGGVDSYGDTVHPGAFKDTVKDRQRPIRLRWNHFGGVIGKFTSIMEDDIGLYVEGELTPGHSLANDVRASLKHGAIDGLSIGYMVKRSEDKPTGGKHLYEIELVEISIVEDQADLNAKITSVKNRLDGAESYKEIEAVLRDVGMSANSAKLVISRVKAVHQREVDEKAKPSPVEFLSNFKFTENSHERRNQSDRGGT